MIGSVLFVIDSSRRRTVSSRSSSRSTRDSPVTSSIPSTAGGLNRTWYVLPEAGCTRRPLMRSMIFSSGTANLDQPRRCPPPARASSPLAESCAGSRRAGIRSRSRRRDALLHQADDDVVGNEPACVHQRRGPACRARCRNESPRATCRRSIPAVSPYRSLTNVAWVPFPAPGPPSRTILIGQSLMKRSCPDQRGGASPIRAAVAAARLLYAVI